MIIPIEVIFWKASHRSDKTCIYYIQRKFCSSKTSELRTNVQGQSCHHVNHIVSKSSLRVRAAEKSNSSGTREFTGERQTLCFFGGCVPWVSLFPQVRASICKSCRKKCTGLWQELDLHCKVLKKLACSEHFGRWGQQNLHETVARARFLISAENWHVRSSAESSPLSALHEHWSIWCDTPAIRVCNCLWQNAMAWLRAAKHQWWAGTLASGIAAGGC